MENGLIMKQVLQYYRNRNRNIQYSLIDLTITKIKNKTRNYILLLLEQIKYSEVIFMFTDIYREK